MREFILMKNHTVAQRVRTNSQTGALGRDMKELILIENYSAAQSVKITSAVNII